MKHVLSTTKALSDRTRLRILCALDGGELCVTQLVDLLEVAASTVSAHCRVLEQAGLVESRKDGRWVFYHLPRSVAPSFGRRLLLETLRALADEESIQIDRERLDDIRAAPPPVPRPAHAGPA